jgi:glycosyltransferase involved in cell wall biosynthesis
LVGVSNFVVGASAAAGYPATKTIAIHNGLEIDEWNRTIPGDSIRAEFGLAADDVLMVAVARIATYKGQSLLLQALALVKAVCPNFHLLIVGSEDPCFGNLEELQRMSAHLGLEGHVHFIGFRSDVRKILSACDIFTLPSSDEPFGMVFLEAMMMQKPIAAIESGGVPEIVVHGECGLLSTPNDAEGLANNIITLMDNRELREKLGRNGRERVFRCFSVERMTQEFEDHYRSLVAQ